MNNPKTTFCAVTALVFLGACAEYPEADNAFLDKNIPVGMSARDAVNRIEQSGFMEKGILSREIRRYDNKTDTLKDIVLDDEGHAKLNVQTDVLNGTPVGTLSCYTKPSQGIASYVDRIICFTNDAQGIVTWRQAGARGAGL